MSKKYNPFYEILVKVALIKIKSQEGERETIYLMVGPVGRNISPDWAKR